MGTLVVCVDRTGELAGKAAAEMPVAGQAAVRSMVLEVGLADPEDSGVNTLLEGLRVARDFGDDGEEAVVGVVSGAGEGVVGTDRAVAAQIDELLAEYEPDSAVVVLDSAEDERLVPIIESRVPVDGVDRVVVRQARDLESTYYLLKQFLADEELRATVLVPVGTVLLVFPALMMLTGSLAVAAATITAVLGLFLLYKGLGIDDYVEDLPAGARDALYSGQVSVVTYVVAVGLTLIGVFAGLLGASTRPPSGSELLVVMAFAFEGAPWFALAALAASAGRLTDEVIRADRLRASYLNLPFVAIAVGFVVRGFSAYFLELAGTLPPVTLPSWALGPLTVEAIALTPEQRLAVFVIGGVVVSLAGIRVSSVFSGVSIEEPEEREDREEAVE